VNLDRLTDEVIFQTRLTGAKTRAGKGTEGKDKSREKTSVGSEKVYSSYQMRNKLN
jgi:hypothetical protein